MAFLDRSALDAIGFAAVGRNVLLSDKASVYGSGEIEIGDNVRIDDFCILSAGGKGIRIGSYVHVACYSSLIGAERIDLEDFANVSSRVAIYSSSDDFSGEAMTNPMVPGEYTGVIHLPVSLGRHVVIGAGSVILPGVSIGQGTAVGALSLVKESCDPYSIYAGTPARWIKARQRGFEERERELLDGG